MEDYDNLQSDDSEDSYEREERECALYSQIYHDMSGCAEADLSNCVADYTIDRDGNTEDTPVTEVQQEPEKEETHLVTNDNDDVMSPKPNTQGEISTSSSKRTSQIVETIISSSSDTDSDAVKVIKEVVTVTQDDSDDEKKKTSRPKILPKVPSKQRQSQDRISLDVKHIPSTSDSSDEEEEMPFWARLDSGTHLTDSSLAVHIRTHGRQRHDSIVSHASSALGDNDTDDLVTIRDTPESQANVKVTLEDILNTMPDDGWDIIHTDYTVGKLSTNRSLRRYHNLKCRNCDKTGHLSTVCPEPKKEKNCGICSQLHTRAKDRQMCPNHVCGICYEDGHPTKQCRQLKYIKSIQCNRCRQNGHRAKFCHELWRQWRYTTDIDIDHKYPTVASTAEYYNENPYCAQCGRPGHETTECKMIPFYQSVILPTDVLHYNTFGKEINFKKDWGQYSKNPKKGRGGRQSERGNERAEMSRHKIFEDEEEEDYSYGAGHDGNDELFTTPQHIVNKQGRKRKREVDLRNKSEIPNSKVKKGLKNKTETPKKSKSKKKSQQKNGKMVEDKKSKKKLKRKAAAESHSKDENKTSKKIKQRIKDEQKQRAMIKDKLAKHLGIRPSEVSPALLEEKIAKKKKKNLKDNTRKRQRRPYNSAQNCK